MQKFDIYFDLNDVDSSRSEFETIVGSRIKDEHWEEIMSGITEIYSDDLDPARNPLGVHDALGMYGAMLLKDSKGLEEVKKMIDTRLAALEEATSFSSELVIKNVRMTETKISRGLTISEALEQLDINENTYSQWRKEYEHYLSTLIEEQQDTPAINDLRSFPQPDPDWQPNIVTLCVFKHEPYDLLETQRISLLWGSPLIGDDCTSQTQRGVRSYINWWIQDRSKSVEIIKFDAFWHNSESVLVTLELAGNTEEFQRWINGHASIKPLDHFTLHPETGSVGNQIDGFVIAYRVIEVSQTKQILSSSYTLESSTPRSIAVNTLLKHGYKENTSGRNHGSFDGTEYQHDANIFFISDLMMIPVNASGKILLPTDVDPSEQRDIFNTPI